MFVPVQDNVTLHCSVEETYTTDWKIYFATGEEAEASNHISQSILIRRGFALEGESTPRSTLLLWETGDNQTNNATNITCLARGTADVITGNTVVVIFYSK